VFFKYWTDNGKVDDVEEKEKEDLESEEQSSSSSSKKLESKNLLLKEIELRFWNGFFFTEIKKMFLKFYRENNWRINHL
jgi:hypothetical protein